MHFIFDLDGTILDTEFEASRITAAVAAERGCVISAEEVFEHFSGWSAAKKFESIADICGIKIPADEILRMELQHHKEKISHTMAGHSPDIIPGAVDLLDALVEAEHIKSLASSLPTVLSKPALDKARLRHHFNDRVFGPDNSDCEAKPDPGVYRRAIATAPDVAGPRIVIEDSLPGVIAGHAAGAFFAEGTFVIARLDPRFGNGATAKAKTAEFKRAGASLVIRDYEEISGNLPRQLGIIQKLSGYRARA